MLYASLFVKAHVFDQAAHFLVIRAYWDDDLLDHRRVVGIVENGSQKGRGHAPLNRNVAPDTLMVPVLINHPSDDFPVPFETYRCRSLLKITAENTPCNPMADFRPRYYIPAHPV